MPAMSQSEDQPRSLVRAMVIVALIGVVAAIVVLCVWMLPGANRRRFATFPDGSTVEFLGTTVGNASFTTEKKWQSIARHILPPRFQNWIPAAITSGCGTASNSVTVHLRLANAAGGAGTPTLWQSYVAEDDSGFRYPSGGGYCSSSDALGHTTYALTLSAYPRRQKEFLFDFLDSKGAVIASLRVPNPVRGPFPEWQPAPMPQTQTNGPVRLTLEKWEEIEEGQWYYPRLKFHLQATDPAWTEARERYSTLVDATGNEGSFLSRRERVWKLKTSVFRERPQDFATNEQVILTNIAVPAAGQFVAIDRSVDRDGVGIKVLVLAGAGQFGISNGVTRFMFAPPTGTGSHSTSSWGTNSTESWGIGTPTLLVEARNMQSDDDLQFHVRDDTGQELKVASYGYDGMNSGARMYKPSFTPSDGAKFVTVQIMVNRPLRFEFLVNPADVPDGKP
jgi:hypothetical protein